MKITKEHYDFKKLTIKHMNKFNSTFKQVGVVNLPAFSNARVIMMPVELGNLNSIPEALNHWKDTIKDLFNLANIKTGIGYITIDEKIVKANTTHRRQGLHVDGVYQGRCGGWGGGGGGSWGSLGNGMLTVSNIAGCKAWNQEGLFGKLGQDGEADHFASQLRGENATIFQPNNVYWVDGLCIHESLSMQKDCERQFVRLSMPSNGPWFTGYTENPLGIKPTGEILPRRQFQNTNEVKL